MGKSGNHKKENTFRFQTFSERIANINIDVIHQIRHYDDTPEESGTYFGEALDRQSELNCTDNFSAFRREIVDQVSTFAQLVHHEEQIVKALKKHLLIPHSMALPAILDLVVQLARDLQKDFYRHFREFFDILVSLLNTYTQDSEVLEKTFSCLSYLFKFLWRYLVKDLEQVFGYFSSLLGHNQKEHVRNFAAESFAFLMRKVKDHSSLFDFMFSSLKDCPDKCDGVGRVLFEMLKGVQGQFHSCLTKVLPVLLSKLGPNENQPKSVLPWELVEDSLRTMFESMATHSSKDKMAEVWSILLEIVSSTFQKCQTSTKKKLKIQFSETLESLLRLLQVLISYKKGHVITNPETIAKVLLECVRGTGIPQETGVVLLDTVSSLLTNSYTHIAIETTSRIISAVYQSSFTQVSVYQFTRSLFSLPLFEKDVLYPLIKYIRTHIAMEMKSHDQSCDLTLRLVAQLALHKCPLIEDGSQLEKLDTYMLDFGPHLVSGDTHFPSTIVSMVTEDLPKDREGVARLWAVLVCLPHVRPIDASSVIPRVASLASAIMTSTDAAGSLDSVPSMLLAQAIVTMVMLLESCDQALDEVISLDQLVQCMSTNASNLHVLRAMDIYISHMRMEGNIDKLTLEVFLKLLTILEENLSSPSSRVRLLTLRILSSFDLPLPPSEVEHEDVFQVCLHVETTPATVYDYRDKQRHLQKLEYTCVQSCLPSGPLHLVPLRYLVGCLFINFTLLWEPIRGLIASYAHGMDKTTFWGLFTQYLHAAADKAEMQQDTLSASPSEPPAGDQSSLAAILDECMYQQTHETSTTDYLNWRCQLWKAMHEFSDKCEPKSREYMPLFFRFLKNEYYQTDLSVAPTQNILKKNMSQDKSYNRNHGEKDNSKKGRQSIESKNKADNPASINVDDQAITETREVSTPKVTRRSRRLSNSSHNADTPDKHHVATPRQLRSRKLSEASELGEETELPHPKRLRRTSARLSESESVDSPRRLRKHTDSEGSLKTEGTYIVETRGQQGRRKRTDSDVRQTDNELADGQKKEIVKETRRYRTRSCTSEASEANEIEMDVTDDDDIEVDNNVKSSRSKSRQKRLSLIEEKQESVKQSPVQSKSKLSLNNSKVDEGEKNGPEDEEKEVEHEGEDDAEAKTGGSKKNRRAVTSTLLVYLHLFAKFRDPRSLYMEPKLRQLYFDLLVHKSLEVQKAAFACIMTYKHKYLMPYKENFERLLDDKTFKTEIVLFSIDHENSAVNKDHRQELLPVLMRILYGKMQVKTGKGTTGKQYSYVRQSIVFRFLNGCSHEELKMFIDLVFAPFQHFVTGHTLTMVKQLKDNIDLSRVLPVKKLQGALNTMDVLLKKLGHMLDSYLPSLLKIILGMATTCTVCLDARESIVPYVIAPLKSLRQMTFNRIIQIFDEYDKYEWYPGETDAIFETLVWPQLDKLSYEGLYTPTPLLKLISCWSKSPRLYPLLAKHHEHDHTLTPLGHVTKLLLHKDISSKVATFIMEIFKRLLQQPQADEVVTVVTVNHMTKLPTAENVKDEELGVRLILPYIPDILQHLQSSVDRLQKIINKKHDTYTELKILSRVSSFVTDQSMCSTLISLLLPFLHKKVSKSAATEEDILLCIQNLLSRLDDQTTFYNDISALFATMKNRNSRTLLCQAFSVLCEKDEQLSQLASIVKQLNSWDTRRMEDPDYMQRLEGYKLANSMISTMDDMDPRICCTLLHNCCFFINNVEDMSIRDSSTHCLVTIVTKMGDQPQDTLTFRHVISNGLLPEIKMGLRSKDEAVRHEFITVLVSMLRAFKDMDRFDDLRGLMDTDIETDFYENIKHIQLHKRSRSLRRLITYISSHQCKVDTLMTYFLPIISSFITDEKFKKYSAVQDSAVDAVGVVCRQLPWKHYLYQLNFFLKMLQKKVEHQKLYVRVIVSVLNGFHFDLSNSTFNMKLAPQVKTEEVVVIKEKADADSEDVSKADDDDEDPPVPEINEGGEEEEVVLQGKLLCPEPMATKIHQVVYQTVITQLHSILVAKIRSEAEHKLARSSYAEDDEILRVPIALAMVKLLQNLPSGALQKFLPGILLKVCNFLKSRSNDIRNTSRDTLIKIQESLGPRYFPFILSELRGSLKRGYQRHVLCFTVYQLLKNMADTVKPGDIDVCLKSLQEVSNEEIFGEQSDEKDVEGIVSKVFEARTNKSYDSYELIAKYISKGSLMNLILPLKQILDTTHSHKSAKKVQEVLKKIVHGLMDNPEMTTEVLLVFVNGLTTQTLPMLADKQDAKPKVEERPGQRRENCLLIKEAAPRGGVKPKTSKKTNIHVLVEFGLQLLNQCQKRQKIVSTDVNHLQMVDPLVPMLAECLFSKYIKVNSNSLRVLCWVLRLKLPSLKDHIMKIASGMFILLRNYASSGAARGDNLELISMVFKAVTVLVKEVRVYTISSDQLHVLLTFCEEDLHDYNRQSTAFSLLKAILSRKIKLPEIQELMKKIQEMSITAESRHVQRECRQVMLQYMLDYPLGTKLQTHLEFYVSQLTYTLENGRESALEMLAAFFNSFPQNLLQNYSGLFFLPMAANLVNDESPNCRKLTALALKSLLGTIDHNHRTNLFSMALKWFMDPKLRHRTLASQLCGLFVEVEGAKFESRLGDILPIIEQQLEPGRYKIVDQEALEHDQDHMIYNTLNTLIKILRVCTSVIVDTAWEANMNIIWDHVQSHLTYPHIWVQLAGSQLMGLLFAAWKPDDLVSVKTHTQWITIDTLSKLRSLAIDFLTQLQSELLNEDLASQVIKNLIFVTRCARLMEDKTDKSIPTDDAEVVRLSTLWLVRKMTREAHHEALYNNKVPLKRMNVFKWLAAVSMDLGPSMSNNILKTMLGPLQREITDQSATQDPALKSLSQEVVEMLKKCVGVERFTQVFSSSQQQRTERRDERKRNRAYQAVANPEQAAKRKVKKNLAKKDSKKRKMEVLRPSKKAKKRSYQELAITDLG